MRAALRKDMSKSSSREMRFAPRSVDAETRYGEAVLSTETPVKRWYGIEVLRCTAAAVDTSRLADAMPLLDSHDRSSVDSILGYVEKHWFEGRKIVVGFRIKPGSRGDDILRQIEAGMIRKVSVGYSIEAFEESRTADRELQITATRWTPTEVSFVAVPADHNASIRSKEGTIPMPKAQRRGPAAPEPDLEDDDELDVVDHPTQQRSQSPALTVQAQRAIDSIRQRTINAGIASADIDVAFEDVRSVDEARTRAFDLLARRSSAAPTNPIRTNDLIGGAMRSAPWSPMPWRAPWVRKPPPSKTTRSLARRSPRSCASICIITASPPA